MFHKLIYVHKFLTRIYLKYYEFRIAELHSRGIEYLDDEEITKLMLLKEEETVEACISPMLQYYTRYFYKQPMTLDRGK